MTRFGGFFIAAGLLCAAYLLHQRTYATAQVLVAGEAHGLSTVRELYERSHQLLGQGTPHPGLEALLQPEAGDDLGLELLADLSTGEQAFAKDDVYVYAMATTIKAGYRQRFGFAVRAWPLSFGETGDREYYVTEAGRLFEGLNLQGRGGHRKEDLPAVPVLGMDDPRVPWIPIWDDSRVYR